LNPGSYQTNLRKTDVSGRSPKQNMQTIFIYPTKYRSTRRAKYRSASARTAKYRSARKNIIPMEKHDTDGET
jgi:hypothetical protein